MVDHLTGHLGPTDMQRVCQSSGHRPRVTQVTQDRVTENTGKLTLALVRGGVGWTSPHHGFSPITRVKRAGSPRNVQYPRIDRLDTYCEDFKSMSCQVIKL